jgi:E3 ubiquitin-protein ligase HUWE1
MSRIPVPEDIHNDFLQALSSGLREEILLHERLDDERRNGAPSFLNFSNRQAPVVTEDKDVAKLRYGNNRESPNLIGTSGLSHLLKLIFLPDFDGNQLLLDLFSNLCENSRNRAELLGMLISLIVDNVQNLGLADKSFSASIFEKLAVKFGVDSQSSVLYVFQKSLETLYELTMKVTSVRKYFLTEIETSTMKTPKSGKKGKGRSGSTTYPIVMLLNLLEKENFINNPTILEPLVQLLCLVLRPLAHIAKKKYSAHTEQVEENNSIPNPSTELVLDTPVKAIDKTTEQTPHKERAEARLPVIPQHSVINIINVLKNSACTGKSFQHTLSIIQFLASYPENLAALTGQLLRTAQELGDSVFEQVSLLIENLRSIEGSESISNEILQPFTSATSSQVKFLRILKTFDFLYMKKHGKVNLTKVLS